MSRCLTPTRSEPGVQTGLQRLEQEELASLLPGSALTWTERVGAWERGSVGAVPEARFRASTATHTVSHAQILQSPHNLRIRYCYCPHCADEEIEAQTQPRGSTNSL